MIEVRSRAHRILKPLANYSDLTGAELSTALSSAPKLSPSEEPIGIYWNQRSNTCDAILFTTDGLYQREPESWRRILYSDIDRAISPSNETNVTGLNILLKDGTEIWLSVKGSARGRFFDAFEVVRFLNRLTETEAIRR
jgi:hypothetical protein